MRVSISRPVQLFLLGTWLVAAHAMQQPDTREHTVIEWLNSIAFAEADSSSHTADVVQRDYKAWLNAGRQIEGAEEILKELLATRDRRVDLAQVAYALGWLGGEKSGSTLTDALSDADSRIRIEAAASVGRIKFASAVKPLCTALSEDRDSNVRANAAWALGEIGGPVAHDCLARAVSDPDPFVRDMVKDALRNAHPEKGAASRE